MSIQRISKSCLDHIRGWLTFTEIHNSRRVAKRWSEIKDVEKIVAFNTDDAYFGFTANFDKVTSLEAWFYEKDDEAKAPYAAMLFIYRMIKQNIHTLKFLHLYWDAFADNHMTHFIESFPKLPILKTLSMSGHWERKLRESFIYYCPNIEKLSISVHFGDSLPSLDFSKVRKLRCVELGGYIEDRPPPLQNVSVGNVATLVYCPMYLNIESLQIWIKSFPNISIILQTTIHLRGLKLKNCIWNENELVITDLEFGSKYRTDPRRPTPNPLWARKTAPHLKSLVDSMRLMRGNFDIKCAIDGNITEMQKLGASALLQVIAAMDDLD